MSRSARPSSGPSGTTMPAARARSATACTSMPVPSSLISSTTDSPAVAALSRIVPSGRLPAAIRCSGVSMAWLIALRTRWMTGSIMRSIRNLSISVLWPDEIELHAFTAVAREIANDERHPAEDLSDRHQADAHHAFAKVAQLPLDARAVLLQRPPPLLERHMLDALQRILQAGARDDHVADEAHEIVEPGQVHANEIGGAAAAAIPRGRSTMGGSNAALRKPGAAAGSAASGSTPSGSYSSPSSRQAASCSSLSVSTSNSNDTPPPASTLGATLSTLPIWRSRVRIVSTFTPRATSSGDGTNVTFHRGALDTAGVAARREAVPGAAAPGLPVLQRVLRAVRARVRPAAGQAGAVSARRRLEQPGAVDQRLEIRLVTA